MIKKLSIALLVLCSFCFVGCNVPDGDSFLVTHDFDNYGDYKTFYDNFCEYNQERYIMPQNTESIEFVYHFTGVADIEYCNTDYNYLDYWHVFMSFEIKEITEQSEIANSEYFLIKFSARNIADEYDYVCNNISQIRCDVKTDNISEAIGIYVGDIEVASTDFGLRIDNEYEFDLLKNKIISAYKGGL